MASFAAVVSPPPPNPLDSDIDDGDEESEYEEIEEEIEVEEEVEFEEEVEDEDVEGEDNEIGEDLTPVREEGQVNDTNENMEPEEQEEHIQSGSMAQGTPVSNPLVGIATVQRKVDDFETSKSNEKEELHIHGERTSTAKDPKASSFNNSGEVNHVKTMPLFLGVNTALIPADASREKDSAVVSVTAENNRTALENVDNIGQPSPRLHVPQVRLRDPTSSAESDRDNKKLRIVCEFHAKGWCIKGKSCRFLHVDGLDAAGNKSEILERKASSGGATPKLNIETEKFVPHKDDTFGSTPVQAGKGIFGPNLFLDNYSHYGSPLVKGSLIERNSTYHGKFSGSTSHDSKRSTGISAFGATLEGTISKESDMVHCDPRPADLPISHPRRPLSFNSSSWNTDALGTHNLLERRASLSSSLQQSVLPVSASESANLSRNHIFRGTELRKCITRISFVDWEPSVPFLPSHNITRSLLMKQRLYDPIRDGIGKKNTKDGPMPVKFSFSDQGSSIKNVNVHSKSSEEEEKLLNSSHVGDTVKDNFLSSSYDTNLKFQKPTDKTEVKDEGSGKHDETPVDFKGDGHVQIESKAFKYFQGALIEFVKELVKPTWREGLLSKDAHKVIVKKAVDKVLSTLQPHQIPSTSESIKLYLSSSQPKLAKLVEGYIDKYGKF